MRTQIAALASFVLLYAAPASADPVHEALEGYALYQNDVSLLLDLEVDGADDINSALARLSRHNPARVSRGYVAYGALTAAQAPAFVSGIERRVREEGRAQVLQQLRADTTYARRQAAGSTQAIRLVLTSANSDGARAMHAGGRYEHIARTSTAAWIRSAERRGGVVTPTSARLSSDMRGRLHVGPLAGRPMNDADAFGGRRFWDSLAGRQADAPRTRGGREQREYVGVTDRMLTLGALVALDAVDGERRRVSELLNEPLTQNCLEMQRLQLRQCLSVSVDASERTYCLGRHGLSGPGACFSAMAR